MVSARAHLLLFVLAFASPAAACGAGGEVATVAGARAEGEIVLAQGRLARWGGLVLAPQAAPALARLAGRRLRVVDLAPPDRWGRRVVDLVAEDGRSVGLDLVLAGFARVRPEPETAACDAERFEAEAAARAAGEGVWGEKGAVLDAQDAPALRAADGRFVFVDGAVRRVGERGAKVYLDFARAGGFAVVVAGKAEPRFRNAGLDLRRLAGRRVLVRGVLDDRFGPRIEIADPADIEILDGVEE